MPWLVVGPVDFWEFAKFAANCAGDAMLWFLGGRIIGAALFIANIADQGC